MAPGRAGHELHARADGLVRLGLDPAHDGRAAAAQPTHVGHAGEDAEIERAAQLARVARGAATAGRARARAGRPGRASRKASRPLRRGCGELGASAPLRGRGQLEVRAGAPSVTLSWLMRCAARRAGRRWRRRCLDRRRPRPAGALAPTRESDSARAVRSRGTCRPRVGDPAASLGVPSVAVTSMMLASGLALAASLPSSVGLVLTRDASCRRVQRRWASDQRLQRGQLTLERGGVRVADARLDVQAIDVRLGAAWAGPARRRPWPR